MSTTIPMSLLLLLAVTTSCYGWRPEPLSPETTRTTLPHIARLTLQDGRKVEIADPRIAHDTLLAWERRDWEFGRRVPVMVPVSQIQAVEIRHVSPAKTTAAALGVVVPIGLLVALVVALSNFCPVGTC